MVTVCPSQFATRRTLFHVLVGCGLLMLKVSRLKLPVIWLLVSMWLNTLTKSQIWTFCYMAVGFYVAKYVNKKSDMDLAAKGQIGRASCRERVEMSVGALSLKKKKVKDGDDETPTPDVTPLARRS